MIIGRAPGCAECFACFKASRRCSGSSFSICPLAMAKLETSYSPHLGQAMLMPSSVTSTSSALAPQTRQFMCWLRWLRVDEYRRRPNPGPMERRSTGGGRAACTGEVARAQGTRPLSGFVGKRSRIFASGLAASRTHKQQRSDVSESSDSGTNVLFRGLARHANGIPTRSPPQPAGA